MWPRETHQLPDDSSQNPKNLFRWIEEKTWIRWHVWERTGTLENVNCLDAYDSPSRVDRFADRHSDLLTDDAVAKLKDIRIASSLPLATYASHSSSFPVPSFHGWKEDYKPYSGTPLYALDLVNSQAELDKLTSQIKNPTEWRRIYNWMASRRYKVRRFRSIANGDEAPTSYARDRDELDFEFRDPATSHIIGEKDRSDVRLAFIKRWIETLEKGDGPKTPDIQ
ncbi:hypothetical protein QQZ08_011748 [Neonectria magnoliae]|uniref:Uncharacterized protein n=1 Tax=Neonectria magnoliae TaxID=2732573 RepID=A0ABR1H7S1_9HYPO